MDAEKSGSSEGIRSDQHPEQQKRIADLKRLMLRTEQRVARRDAGRGSCSGQDIDLAGDDRSLRDWCSGVPEIDSVLPFAQMNTGSVHEVSGAAYGDAVAAAGYCLALIKQLADALKEKSPAPILWCQTAHSRQEFGSIHGSGLMAFGLHPTNLLLVDATHNRDVLWALEEGARSGNPLAVVGEIDTVSFMQTRRLSLAAAVGGTPVILLRPHNDLSASAAETRWRIAAAPSAPDPYVNSVPGNPRWQVELVRCRGGRPGSWSVEWSHETYRFCLVEKFPDRSSQVANAAVGPLQTRVLPRRSVFG